MVLSDLHVLLRILPPDRFVPYGQRVLDEAASRFDIDTLRPVFGLCALLAPTRPSQIHRIEFSAEGGDQGLPAL